MAELNELVKYLDEVLKVNELADYPGAYNGLQLQNSGEVCSIAAAVDSSEPVIAKAVEMGVDLLVVHHGMFWQGVQKVEGAFYRKLKLAMENNMAIYSAHLPLDVHPEFGNNILLAKAIGMDDAQPYGDWKGLPLGVKQDLDCDLVDLVKRVEVAVGGDVHVCPGAGNPVGTVGVVTGGAGSEVQKMYDEGIRTFITGEGPHWSYSLAEELGINVIYAGHYATETFGVKKISEELANLYTLDAVHFVDHPTGL